MLLSTMIPDRTSVATKPATIPLSAFDMAIFLGRVECVDVLAPIERQGSDRVPRAHRSSTCSIVVDAYGDRAPCRSLRIAQFHPGRRLYSELKRGSAYRPRRGQDRRQGVPRG